MPVRIYDISKKLGLENKVILAKAKSLGIAAAKVPSSSLDKISAEYLEEQLCIDHPELAAKLAPPPPPAPKAAPERNRLLSSTRRRRNRPNRKSKKNRRRSIEPPPVVNRPNRRHRPNRPDRRLAKKSGSFNCRHARSRARRQSRFGQTAAVASRRVAEDRIPGRHSTFIRRPSSRAAGPRTGANPPPRRSPNLSRPRPAKSSSSNRRLSCANWPRSSSRSRSRSSPI